MNIKWRKLLLQGSMWLSLEIAFNLMGIDTIADYSEYIFQRHQIILICLGL
jgi:hypothetical protein